MLLALLKRVTLDLETSLDFGTEKVINWNTFIESHSTTCTLQTWFCDSWFLESDQITATQCIGTQLAVCLPNLMSLTTLSVVLNYRRWSQEDGSERDVGNGND